MLLLNTESLSRHVKLAIKLGSGGATQAGVYINSAEQCPRRNANIFVHPKLANRGQNTVGGPRTLNIHAGRRLRPIMQPETAQD